MPFGGRKAGQVAGNSSSGLMSVQVDLQGQERWLEAGMVLRWTGELLCGQLTCILTCGVVFSDRWGSMRWLQFFCLYDMVWKHADGQLETENGKLAARSCEIRFSCVELINIHSTLLSRSSPTYYHHSLWTFLQTSLEPSSTHTYFISSLFNFHPLSFTSLHCFSSLTHSTPHLSQLTNYSHIL